ncbi:MAG: ferritin family protein [Candidatus Thermoplasmatota archaeon]
MNLQNYTLEEIFLAAIKSEVESRDAYADLANGVKNAFLRERLRFLSGEEDRHREFLWDMCKKRFPERQISLPKKSPIPLPVIRIWEKGIKLSEVIGSAMEAEKGARDFYHAFAHQMGKDPEIAATLEYFSSMEWSHYRLLEIEREHALRYEAYDEYWPMMHVGP